jgi:hypothetical protein
MVRAEHDSNLIYALKSSPESHSEAPLNRLL